MSAGRPGELEVILNVNASKLLVGVSMWEPIAARVLNFLQLRRDAPDSLAVLSRAMRKAMTYIENAY